MLSKKNFGLSAVNYGIGNKKNILGGVINREDAMLYADKALDEFLIDRIGRTTFDPVPPVYAVGDGATYWIIQKDGIYTGKSDLSESITLKRTATNVYETAIEFYEGTTTLDATTRVFGLKLRNDGSIAVASRGTFLANVIPTGVILAGVYYTFSIVMNNNTVGYIEVNGTQYSFDMSNTVNISDIGTINLSSGISGSEALTGSVISVSLNDQYIFNPQALGSNDFIKLQRTSEDLTELYAQQYVQPATPTVEDDSLAIGSPLNEDGYIVAGPLGTNLFNDDNLQIGYLQSNGTVIALEVNGERTSDTFIKVLPNTDYILQGYFPNRTSSSWMAICEYSDNSYASHILRNTTITQDIDSQELTITTSSTTQYVLVSARYAEYEGTEIQLEEGSTATTYEAWEGYYLDEDMTIPYPDGTPIQRILGTTKADAWVSDGAGGSELADCDIGRVKFNPRIVDGVVDNGVDYGNWDVSASGASIVNGNRIRLVQGIDVAKLDTELKASTQYTIVVNISGSTGTTGLGLQQDGGGQDTVFVGDTSFGYVDGEVRKLSTTKATITNNRLYFILSGMLANEQLDFTVTVYEGDYVTDTPPLPTSATFEDGNSWVLDTAYNQAVKVDGADGLDGDYVFDETDPTAVTSKVIPCDTASRGDYIFTSLTKGIVALYDTVQTGDTLAKIKTKLGIS